MIGLYSVHSLDSISIYLTSDPKYSKIRFSHTNVQCLNYLVSYQLSSRWIAPFSLDPVVTQVRNHPTEPCMVKCIILSGNPRTGKLVWYVNDTQIQESSKQLTDNSIHKSDDKFIITSSRRGFYKCLLNNAIQKPTCQQYYFVGKYLTDCVLIGAFSHQLNFKNIFNNLCHWLVCF